MSRYQPGLSGPAVETAAQASAPSLAVPLSQGEAAGAESRAPLKPSEAVPLPDYLKTTYSWAYLNPVSRALFDQWFVVQGILWGNAGKLVRAVLEEVEPGQHVLQTACVYGTFSNQLAEYLGPQGALEVIDVAPIQVHHTRRKLKKLPQARVRLADAARPGDGTYDAVCCFFLLHEVPRDYKTEIVDALLQAIRPGGKVVFVDYHRPNPRHPLKGLMKMVFAALEPYAHEIWDEEIARYATNGDAYSWRKSTFFGDLYQKVVVTRR